jgi:hypothetical protein
VDPRPKRRLLVEPKFQYELIGWALLAFTAATAVLGGIIWFVLQDVWVLGESIALPADHAYFTRLAELRASAGVAIAVTFVGLGAGVIYGGLVRSRRIVGPILALRRHLDDAADGQPSPIVFRADDHFADLSARFNRLVDALKGGHE